MSTYTTKNQKQSRLIAGRYWLTLVEASRRLEYPEQYFHIFLHENGLLCGAYTPTARLSGTRYFKVISVKVHGSIGVIPAKLLLLSDLCVEYIRGVLDERFVALEKNAMKYNEANHLRPLTDESDKVD